MTSQNAFGQYVDRWDETVGLIEALKKQLKPLVEKEMEMRKAIADSINAAQPLKEGVNKFPLPDGRRLKVTHKLTRTIDGTVIPLVREDYSKLNDNPVTFDELLRIKYELDKRSYDKLEGEAAKVVSKMVTTKPAAPVVEFD